LTTQALTPPQRLHISRRALPPTPFPIQSTVHQSSWLANRTHSRPSTDSPTQPPSQPQQRSSLVHTHTQMSDMATWKSSSTGGSSQTSKASTLFGLDEEDKANILVYRYRSGCKALEVSTQRDLCRELDAGKLEIQPLRAASLTGGGLYRPAAAFHARHQEGDSSRQQPVRDPHRGPSLARGPRAQPRQAYTQVVARQRWPTIHRILETPALQFVSRTLHRLPLANN
jgi:hypothetical protein